MNELITITQPNGDELAAREAVAAIMRREADLKAEFAAAEEMLATPAWADTKPEWARLNAIDDELKSLIKQTEKSALAFAQADRILVQLKATRKNLAAIHDRAWSRFVELRDADKPVDTPSTFVIELTCRGKDFEPLVAAAIKKLGRDNVRWGKSTTDKAFAAVKAAMKELEH